MYYMMAVAPQQDNVNMFAETSIKTHFYGKSFAVFIFLQRKLTDLTREAQHVYLSFNTNNNVRLSGCQFLYTRPP